MSERNKTADENRSFDRDLWDSMMKFWGALEEIRERSAAEGLPLWIDQEVTAVLDDWEHWVELQL